jgi:hypothetical protein
MVITFNRAEKRSMTPGMRIGNYLYLMGSNIASPLHLLPTICGRIQHDVCEPIWPFF